MFLTVWIVRYAVMDKRPHDALSWVRTGPEMPFGIARRGSLSKSDIAPMLVITLLYAAAALYNLGNMNAPQTFWRALPDTQADAAQNSVLIDLGETACVEKLYYYCGNFSGPDGRTHYEFAMSEDGVEYREQAGFSQLHSQTFSWRVAEADGLPARYIRVTALYAPIEIGELCVIGEYTGGNGRGGVKLSPAAVTPERGWLLFDEQGVAPEPGGPVRTPLNGSYFDEIYHARAAYEFMNGDRIYETTHPPLGKEMIWAGVTVFGMTPFGWRIVGAVFGILMLPLFYLLLKQLFGSTQVSAAATAVWAADFMHLTQTRIATIDTYNVFFVLLMFLFMH
ncbi:MAG: glycosyltransferase family 39 protein, partial [Oscillospiraceae bacterium]|nr:glycosyltransferase family 39 protein [Oscillospiraceae bacterium]